MVYGLGLIGLLTVQLLRASGCRVIGIDRDSDRLALAERLGATVVEGRAGTSVEQTLALTGGVGADAVLLTLASTENEPMHEAAAMSRQRGRLVLVGTTGLDLAREDFYRKELSFAVSCSYGPGRYDPLYEERGQDYPVGFVRWTAQRNFDAVLALMATGAVDPLPLVTHRFPFADAPAAYDVIAGSGPSLGVVLVYPDRGGVPPDAAARTLERTGHSGPRAATEGSVAVIGSGNFAMRTFLPSLMRSGAHLRTIASTGGAGGAIAAERFGFERATSDLDAVFGDAAVDTVFVLTRHDSHAALALRALEARKHVFVEKPLALKEEELARIAAAAAKADRMLMVGFNRRFAPLAREAKSALASRAGPLAVLVTVNAGNLSADHWTKDSEVGGGRIVGEACHFIDLARFLVGAPITALDVTAARSRDGGRVGDVAHLSLSFADGSTAAISYLANGARAFPKERIECFFDERTIAIDNWRRLHRFGVKGPWLDRPRELDKGHDNELAAWMDSVRHGGPPPIPLEELIEVSTWAIRAEAMA
ncbi:MAG TPA: bi-domain-containing oxidoreductase [Gemmatimonadaceae bacterium]|nr:bi-domain-containing oxidoreductase [Gemmatimonadaceae bacterium]